MAEALSCGTAEPYSSPEGNPLVCSVHCRAMQGSHGQLRYQKWHSCSRAAVPQLFLGCLAQKIQVSMAPLLLVPAEVRSAPHSAVHLDVTVVCSGCAC